MTTVTLIMQIRVGTGVLSMFQEDGWWDSHKITSKIRALCTGGGGLFDIFVLFYSASHYP